MALIVTPLHRSARRILQPLALGLVLVLTYGAGSGAAAGPSTRSAASDRVGGSPPLGAATPYLEGLDVSHWQGAIDWTQVAAAGKTFAIMKATQGTDYVDPTYATNHAQAVAAGLWTSTYHFASPDATPNDAVLEADHFVAVASLGTHDVIPALDLEVTGGLSTSALQTWVGSWLGEVTAKIGVRPMIYTSPAFWRKYMGDSPSFAQAGYPILWIAHWGVPSPTLPAQNWGGRGWTFWQYSNCGKVPGIGGCVDLDRYRGTDFTPVAYSVFKVVAPGPGTVKQGQTAVYTVGIARTNFGAPVAMSVSGLPAGANAVFAGNPTTDPSTRLTVTTSAALPSTPPGTYPLAISGVGQGLTRTTSVNLVVTDGIPPTVGPPLVRVAGSGTLSGSTVPVQVIWSATDPGGISSSALQRNVNRAGWRAVRMPRATSIATSDGIASGATAVYRVRASDRNANTSAWTFGPSARALLVQQSSRGVAYAGTWRTATGAYLSGGSLRYASAAGASVSYSFWGSSVGWVAFRGPNRGAARVYVDGVYVQLVNLYARTYAPKSIVFATNWSARGTHTIRIVVVGTAGRPRVDVDAFALIQ